MSSLAKPRINLFDQLLDRAVLPGILAFTRQGYCLRSLSAEALPKSITGRRIVITGATSGLGLAAAQCLAAMDAHLVLVGRDEAKLARTVAEIGRATGATLQTECADLASMSEVRTLAGRLLASPAPIHVLVNNAGALFPSRALTAEGHERSLAVNLMAPFLLTNLLIPRLVESTPARVITVSSGGMYTQRIRVDDLQYERSEYNGSIAYARAKRGQMILTERWASELADQQVAVHAMHPGWADTPGVRNSLPGFYRVTRPLLRSAEQGADTVVWLASAEAPAQTTGGFWLDRAPHPTHVLPWTRATEDEKHRLWDALEKLTGAP